MCDCGTCRACGHRAASRRWHAKQRVVDRYAGERWPYGALERFIGPLPVANRAEAEGTNDSLVADLLGVSRNTVAYWQLHGLRDQVADRAAVGLRVHPSAIWVDWFQVVEIEDVA